eukprot:SM000038S14401  [mRNA]  locus=s38:696898:697192:+ [translate_table: standard]
MEAAWPGHIPLVGPAFPRWALRRTSQRPLGRVAREALQVGLRADSGNSVNLSEAREREAQPCCRLLPQPADAALLLPAAAARRRIPSWRIFIGSL